MFDYFDPPAADLFLPPVNPRLTSTGTITDTMYVGKRLRVKVQQIVEVRSDWMGAEYRVEYIGTEKVCLDFGRNWYIYPGDTFITRQGNVDRAAELAAGR